MPVSAGVTETSKRGSIWIVLLSRKVPEPFLIVSCRLFVGDVAVKLVNLSPAMVIRSPAAKVVSTLIVTVRLPFEYATIGLTLAAAFPVIVAVSTVASQVMLNPAG